MGPDIRLMADANQGCDVEYALRLGRKLEDAVVDFQSSPGVRRGSSRQFFQLRDSGRSP
ncbi:MAG: hypothetical protein DMD79_05090 [Candidatus Rokuibacteriota bacterium]|nr:MAG: hypothetical protein DMD79_05090 [Candidatus Rokubacteria bacterium]